MHTITAYTRINPTTHLSTNPSRTDRHRPACHQAPVEGQLAWVSFIRDRASPCDNTCGVKHQHQTTSYNVQT